MAKYLIQANYVSEGVKGLIKEGGTSRSQAIDKLITSMGGSLEAFYYAFGDTDVYLIVDMPDHVSVASVTMSVNASGAVTTKTTVLLSAQEIDEAAKKSPAYRAPGQ